jgi:hypothetical protein
MAKTHMNKYSTSLAIKEMQIKTVLSFHLTLVTITTIKNTDNNKCWQGHKEKETLIHCWYKCKLAQPLCKRLKIDLPYDPTILLLGIYPKECKSGYYKGTCTPMFTAVLFTIARLWKQPRCPTRSCGV